MKRLAALLVVWLCSGCVTYTQGGQVHRTVFLQNGILLQVFNQCTESPGRVYPSTGGTYAIPAGPPRIVPMVPSFLLNTNGYVSATYQVYKGEVLMGSVSRSFYIDRSGTNTIQWIIGGSSGGGTNVFVDRVYGSDGRIVC